MKFTTYIPMLSLQIFAEGADGGGTAQGSGETGAAAVSQPGAKGALTDVKYGIQSEPAAPAAEVQKETVAQPDRNAEYERLIKGEYKDLYGADVQKIVQNRLKSTKETVERYNALTPTIEMLCKKYGVDPTDINALNKAIQDDDSYYEQEAAEKNLTVQQLKEIKAIERQNADLKAQMEEVQRQESGKKLYATWMQQAESAKAVYPTFDMETEMGNPRFVDLLRNNIDVRTAYEVLHKDEIIPAAMQFAAKTVEQKIAKNIATNGARPNENGMSSQSAAVVKSDVSKLTKYDIDEVARRVARGERVTFG